MRIESSVARATFFAGVTGIVGSFLLKKMKYDRLAKGLLIGSSLAAAGGAIAFTATALSKKADYFSGYLTTGNQTPVKYKNLSIYLSVISPAPAAALNHPKWHPRDLTSVPWTSANKDHTITVHQEWFHGIDEENKQKDFGICYISHQKTSFLENTFYLYIKDPISYQEVACFPIQGKDFETLGFSKDAVVNIEKIFSRKNFF